MPFDALTMQVARNHGYEQRVAKSREIQSMLMPGAGDNDIILGIFDRLRAAATPKDVSPSRRKVTMQIDPLMLMFYAKKAEDFIKKDGTVSDMFAVRTAQKFTFKGTVTVTREHKGGAIFWCLTDGVRSLYISERGSARKGYTHRPARCGGFAEPTGYSAGRRKAGRGPRPESEF